MKESTQIDAIDRALLARMDIRTMDEFEEDLDQFTEKEFYLGIAFRYELCARGMECEVLEHGVDNTGKLIKGRLPNHNADKMYKFKSGRKPMCVEIKTIPEYCLPFHFTFKISALYSCIKQSAKILVPGENSYHLLGREAMVWILENGEISDEFEGWGGKWCSRISAWEMRCLVRDGKVTNNEWTPRAQEFIASVKDVILAERKTGAKKR